MSTTTHIEPLPVRWQDEIIGAFMFFVVIALLGSAITSAVMGASADSLWSFLAGIGSATKDSITDVLLGFAATVAFAFGVSLGGQLIVRVPATRSRIRRTTGGVAQLLMVASLLLLAGELTDAARNPEELGVLAATIPLTITTLAFGCHVAGLNVAPFDRQVEGARRVLAQRRAQKARLPIHWTRRRASMAFAFAAHVAVFAATGFILALLNGASSERAVAVMLVTAVAAAAISLSSLATSAAALTAPDRRGRVTARSWPIAVIGFVTLYAWFGSALLVGNAALPIAVLDLVIVALGVAAMFPLPSGTPARLVSWTLNGITARSARLEVLRGIRQVEARERSLEEHRRSNSTAVSALASSN